MGQMPDLLKTGDSVAIVATARKVSPEELRPAIRLFESWGVRVLVGENAYAECDQFAGTDEQRAADLQWALDNADIKAVFCARGGYGTVRIIDRVDFSRFAQHPKWIVGYSDVTVLHSHVHNHLRIPTLHATMPLNIPDDAITHSYPSIESLRKMLFEGRVSYQWAAGNGSKFQFSSQRSETLPTTVSGVVVGGNLSILYSLCGSPSDIDTDGKILFIEDLDEYLYHIDRMMQNLRRTGKLSHLKALIVGGMTDMHDNTIPFGKTAEEIVLDAVKDYDYPVCFNAPFGHLATDNCAIALGCPINLRCDSSGNITIEQMV